MRTNDFEPPQPTPPRPTSYFWSGNALRSRGVSHVVLSGTLDVPEPPVRLVADWERDIASTLALDPGDVEALPLARARMRWPDYRHCVQAASDWTRALGLPEVLAASDIALMACRGARYHHDGEQYGGAAFCNLFLSEDKGLDLPYGCREGICHTCVGELVSGKVRDLRNGNVSGNQGEQIRTCINAPEGPVEINL
jgi:hypothetical protein